MENLRQGHPGGEKILGSGWLLSDINRIMWKRYGANPPPPRLFLREGSVKEGERGEIKRENKGGQDVRIL